MTKPREYCIGSGKPYSVSKRLVKDGHVRALCTECDYDAPYRLVKNGMMPNHRHVDEARS